MASKKPQQGDIVLIPFPFTDLSGTKVRPAIVVNKQSSGADSIVVFITSKKYTKGIPIESDVLKKTSYVLVNKVATLDNKLIAGKIGTLEGKTLKTVITELKKQF